MLSVQRALKFAEAALRLVVNESREVQWLGLGVRWDDFHVTSVWSSWSPFSKTPGIGLFSHLGDQMPKKINVKKDLFRLMI